MIRIHLTIAAVLPIAAASAQALVQRGPVTGAPYSGEFVADLDGNGRPDIVYSAVFTVNVVWNPDLASPNVAAVPLIGPAALGPYFLISLHHVGDMNGDTIDDLVVGGLGAGPNGLYLVPGTGGGSFGPPVQVTSVAGSFDQVAVTDIDGDNDGDVIAGVWLSASSLSELRVYSQGSTGFSQTYTESVGGIGAEFPLLTGDFNGDGYGDTAFYSFYPIYDTRILFGHPTTLGPTAPLTTPFTTATPQPWAAGDLDGDGRDDALWTGHTTSELVVMVGDATSGLVAGPTLIPSGVGDFARARILDFDADGNLDVLATYSTPSRLLVFRGDGAGGFSQNPLTLDLPYQVITATAIDLDGDGDPDLYTHEGPTPVQSERFENRSLYGVGCNGVAGEPRLTIGAASPGQAAFGIGIDNAAPNALAQIVIALDGTAGPCGAQFNPHTVLLPVPGGPIFGLVTDGAGSVRMPLPIPGNAPPGPFFLQGIVLDAAGTPFAGLRLAATRGRAIEIF